MRLFLLCSLFATNTILHSSSEAEERQNSRNCLEMFELLKGIASNARQGGSLVNVTIKCLILSHAREVQALTNEMDNPIRITAVHDSRAGLRSIYAGCYAPRISLPREISEHVLDNPVFRENPNQIIAADQIIHGLRSGEVTLKKAPRYSDANHYEMTTSLQE